ncbi:Transposase (IS1193) [Streptococcus thermophilus ND03]|nr:Transposase (IS1193) [Streptococcus thermophilus ND03]
MIQRHQTLGFGFRNFINFKKRVFITLNIHKKRTYPVLSRC